MRWPVAASVAAFVFQIFLAVTPIIPATAHLWQSENPQAFYGKLAAFVGIQFTLLTASLGLLFIKEFHDVKTLRGEVHSKLPGVEIRRISADHFYNEFNSAARSATFSVNICYFAPYPPAQVSTENQAEYYRDIVRTIRRSRNVTFRRIIRQADRNKLWIAELVEKLMGRRNAHIAVLQRDLPENELMPLALSVQVVDEEKTWIVAIKTHEREDRYRDVYVHSREFGQALMDYYNRLWSHSNVILEHGELTEFGKHYLES